MAETKKTEEKQETAAPEKKVLDVHEVSFVEGKGWSLKREGSTKVIKYYRTKLEAIEAVIRISENRGTRVVVKLKNGKFQKFENATRALKYAQTTSDPD